MPRKASAASRKLSAAEPRAGCEMPRRCAACGCLRAPLPRCAVQWRAGTRRCPEKTVPAPVSAAGHRSRCFDKASAKTSARCPQRARHRSPHPTADWRRIAPAAARLMQIMKFRHRGVARFEHFDEQLSCHNLQVFRFDAICERIHRLPPGPKTIARTHSIFCVSGHGALEGMTVCIGHSGYDDAIEPLDLNARRLRLLRLRPCRSR